MRKALPALSAGIAAVVVGVVAPSVSAAPDRPGSPIKHVIEIMLENHTFDNLFGRFPGANGIPANASFLNPDAYYDSAPNVTPV